jgi:hypothetical protein
MKSRSRMSHTDEQLKGREGCMQITATEPEPGDDKLSK